jgi:hypothetical protein
MRINRYRTTVDLEMQSITLSKKVKASGKWTSPCSTVVESLKTPLFNTPETIKWIKALMSATIPAVSASSNINQSAIKEWVKTCPCAAKATS